MSLFCNIIPPLFLVSLWCFWWLSGTDWLPTIPGKTSRREFLNCRTTRKLQVKVPIRLSSGFTITSPDFLHPPCRMKEAHQNTLTLTFLFRQQQDLEDMDALVQISRSPAQTIKILTYKFLSHDEWVSLSKKKTKPPAVCKSSFVFVFVFLRISEF